VANDRNRAEPCDWSPMPGLKCRAERAQARAQAVVEEHGAELRYDLGSGLPRGRAGRAVGAGAPRARGGAPSASDRFHIVPKLNRALDEVRAIEARRMALEGYEPVLKKKRWCRRL